MERITHDDLVQGSDEWKAHRRQRRNASEASAMLGLSPYTKRNELVRMTATGDEKEFSDYVQKYVLDRGHHVEALTRPIAEEFIGEGLYPSTFSLGNYSCSTDGLTMAEEILWECKQWAEGLAAAVAEGVLPEMHMPQCQQGMMITGATRCLFTVSDGTPEKTLHVWVDADEEWFETLRAGWEQFDEDVANYQHVEPAEKLVADPIKSLPAVIVDVSGKVAVIDNFSIFEEALNDFLNNTLIRKPKTDQDFVNLDLQIKDLKKAEAALDAAEVRMLSQVESIDQGKRTKDMLHKMTRDNRLVAEKLLAAEKKNRRAEILQSGKTVFDALITGINANLGNAYMPVIPVDFAGVMSGKKNIDSLQNAVDTELARVTIEAKAIARKIEININTLRELASDHKTLFPDTQKIVLKENDDLVSLIKVRIAEHEQQEADRIEAEREKIRAEEEAKATAKAEADAKAIRDAEELERAEEQRKADEAERLRLEEEQRAQEQADKESMSTTPKNVGQKEEPETSFGSLKQTLHTTGNVDELSRPENDVEATAQHIIDSLLSQDIGKQTAKKIAGLLIDNKVSNVTVVFATKLAEAS